jgi:glucosamine--fructose-6-phosphate aminotransferase (isomerizing)
MGINEYFVASDATPIIEYTKDVVYLGDEEIAILNRKTGLRITTIANVETTPYVQHLELSLSALEKGGYDHFMLKEIFEQPRSIGDSMRGRLNSKTGTVVLGGILEQQEKIINAKRIIIVACGTSWHAGLVGEYMIEELTRIPVEVEYASEFRYRNPILGKGDVVIAISQSGETADTLAAVTLAKQSGATVIGICNVIGSSIARATQAGSYTHAGPEIGVASTKAFTAQVTLLTLLALMIGKGKGTISEERYLYLQRELEAIPEKVKLSLATDPAVKKIAELFQSHRNFLYLGRGINFPVALEGALKLKEISYIHAEGYPAAEMKHGPIALIDEHMPVIFLANNNDLKEKIVSNIQEVKARKGIVIAIVNEGDDCVDGLADFTISVPETDELLSPLVSIIPLQLLSYHIAVMRGCNVDQPRNLAKSVTVE